MKYDYILKQQINIISLCGANITSLIIFNVENGVKFKRTQLF